jgi:flagellin-like protein
MSKSKIKKMKNKRGLSPLVATVLLIAIVIVIALLIWFWYRDVIEKKQEKEELSAQLICAQQIEFEIRNPGCVLNTDPPSVVFEVENTGTRRIEKFNIVARDPNDNLLGSREISVTVNPPETSDLSIDIDSLTQGQIVKVEVTPIIISGAQHECTGKVKIAEFTCTS